MAVLDTMMEQIDEHNTYIVYYSVLDGDKLGRTPDDPKFDKAHQSCLHKIAQRNNKVYYVTVFNTLWAYHRNACTRLYYYLFLNSRFTINLSIFF